MSPFPSIPRPHTDLDSFVIWSGGSVRVICSEPLQLLQRTPTGSGANNRALGFRPRIAETRWRLGLQRLRACLV